MYKKLIITVVLLSVLFLLLGCQNEQENFCDSKLKSLNNSLSIGLCERVEDTVNFCEKGSNYSIDCKNSVKELDQVLREKGFHVRYGKGDSMCENDPKEIIIYRDKVKDYEEGSVISFPLRTCDKGWTTVSHRLIRKSDYSENGFLIVKGDSNKNQIEVISKNENVWSVFWKYRFGECKERDNVCNMNKPFEVYCNQVNCSDKKIKEDIENVLNDSCEENVQDYNVKRCLNS